MYLKIGLTLSWTVFNVFPYYINSCNGYHFKNEEMVLRPHAANLGTILIFPCISIILLIRKRQNTYFGKVEL